MYTIRLYIRTIIYKNQDYILMGGNFEVSRRFSCMLIPAVTKIKGQVIGHWLCDVSGVKPSSRAFPITQAGWASITSPLP